MRATQGRATKKDSNTGGLQIVRGNLTEFTGLGGTALADGGVKRLSRDVLRDDVEEVTSKPVDEHDDTFVDL